MIDRLRKSEIRNQKSEMRPRSALTLVELLVVIVILLILTTVALPLLAPDTEGRRLREAGRMVSAYVAGTRNRAIETGRPAGVQFERMANNLNACMVLHTVEVPPPYSGESLNSRCKVYWYGSPAKLYAHCDPLNTSDFNNTLVRVGDLIKFNYQNRSYRITGPATSATDPTVSGEIIELDTSAGTPLPWPLSTATSNDASDINMNMAMPYQIIRQPVKSAIPALQLPEGAVVDLCMSGEGMDKALQWEIDPTTAMPPMMIFESAGTVGSLFHFYNRGDVSPPTYRAPNAPVHFLVGRNEGVGPEDSAFPDPEKSPWNIRDPRNLWVSVGSRTGLISTAENAVVPTSPSIASTDMPPVVQARSIAMQMQSTGGR
jgi:type II secretory pathway pseudopilin PulG